jgi:hypothetical protein
MQKWEYMVIAEFPNEEMLINLNRLGQEGWELAAVAHKPGNSAILFCYLKRPVS